MSDSPSAQLTPGQLTALRNLARKEGGAEVDWINISDARLLTDLGLAERNREGWIITAAGRAAALSAPENASNSPETNVSTLRERTE